MAVTEPNDRTGGFGIGGWPIHEVGRNADVFNPEAGKLIKAGSRIGFPNVHLHANGIDTTAHLEVGLKFHPTGYRPAVQERLITIGTDDLDIRPMEANQKVEAFFTLQQPMRLTVFGRTCTPPEIFKLVISLFEAPLLFTCHDLEGQSWVQVAP